MMKNCLEYIIQKTHEFKFAVHNYVLWSSRYVLGITPINQPWPNKKISDDYNLDEIYGDYNLSKYIT